MDGAKGRFYLQHNYAILSNVNPFPKCLPFFGGLVSVQVSMDTWTLKRQSRQENQQTHEVISSTQNGAQQAGFQQISKGGLPYVT